MYDISTQFNELAFAYSNRVYLKIETPNGTLTKDDLLSFNFKEILGDNKLEIGATYSASIEFSMINGDIAVQSGATVYPFISYDNSEWCPLGKFKVSSSKEDNGETTKCIGYDALGYMSEKFSPNADSLTVSEVVDYIASKYGVEVESTTYPSITIDSYIEGISDRDMLAYMSGLMGKNARINRDGKLAFVWYAPIEETITEDEIFDGQIEKPTASTYSINSLVCSISEEDEITYGEGRALSFANPYMTQDQLETIGASIVPFTYSVNSLSYRCNPAFEVGDIVEVLGQAVPIMCHEIEVDGGMTAKLDSYGLSLEQESLTIETSIEKMFKRDLSLLENGLNEIIENLKGNQGGTYKVLYEDGVPIGWAIISNENPLHQWRWTYSGLGYTVDGGSTFKNLAFDLQGNFYANAITAGTMSANRIRVGGSESNPNSLGQYFTVDDEEGHIVVKIGDTTNNIVLKEYADHIGFYNSQGEELMKIYPQGLEIASLSQLKLGDFIIKQNERGGLSFT